MSSAPPSPARTEPAGRRRFLAAGAAGFSAVLAAALSSCATRGGGTGSGVDRSHPAVRQQTAAIQMEPPGDYWVGRRWWTEGTRFWGYMRRPRQAWSEARLVMMNESVRRTPDRLPEEPVSGPGHGFDHNYEYRLWGNFSGREVYDPNSNLMLPEFVLQSYELVSSSPGFLFQPGERYNPKRLPPVLPPVPR